MRLLSVAYIYCFLETKSSIWYFSFRNSSGVNMTENDLVSSEACQCRFRVKGCYMEVRSIAGLLHIELELGNQWDRGWHWDNVCIRENSLCVREALI